MLGQYKDLNRKKMGNGSKFKDLYRLFYITNFKGFDCYLWNSKEQIEKMGNFKEQKWWLAINKYCFV